MKLTASYDDITLEEVHGIFMAGKEHPLSESKRTVVFDSFRREVRVE